MSSGIADATNVTIEPTRLGPGETEARISLRVTSNIDVHEVWSFNSTSEGPINVKSQMFLEQGGNPRDGTWSGTVSFPLNIPDGNYDTSYGAFVPIPGGLRPLRINEPRIGNIRLQRSTIPDTERPEILSYDIQPRVLQGPSEAVSYFSLSAVVRDNTGVVFVTAFGQNTAPGPGISVIEGEGDIPQMTLESGDNNTPQRGRWSGRLRVGRRVTNGVYGINFYAFDAAGNMVQTFENAFESGLTVTVQRSAPEPDNESPSIVQSSVAVRPLILGPGQSEITFSVNARDNRGVQSVITNITPISSGASQTGTVSLQRSAGTPEDGTWTGRFAFPADAADGEYRVSFRGVDAAGNSTSGGPVIVMLQRLQQRPSEPPITDRDGRAITTFTFPGPATIQNITSESGECEVRVSVPRRVVIDCQCPQKSTRENDDTGREQENGRRLNVPLTRKLLRKNTAMMVLSIAAIVIAGSVLAAYLSLSQHDNKCNSWLTRLQNQVMGLLVLIQLDEGPSRTQAQTDRINTMAADYNNELSRFDEECRAT